MAPRVPVDPNETAYEALKDAENIGRDARRRERGLQEYTGDDEDTKRVNVAPEMHVHVHQHSQPDIEPEASVEVGPVKVRGLPKWAIAATGVAVAAIVAIVSKLLAR